LGADGKPEKLLSVSRDITATRQAEEALREALSLNTLILNSSRDCIVVLDLDGHTLLVSPGGIESMEISDVDAILGLSWLRVWKGADHEVACKAVADARSGGLGRFQGFCPTHKGTPKWWDVVICPLPGPDGNPERLVSVGRDITELKHIEQRLALSEERLNLALGASGMVGIWDWDLKAEVVYADANFARIHTVDPVWAARGAPPAEYIKNFHPDDLPVFQAELDRVFAGTDELATEYRVRQPDGSVRWVMARGRLVRDAEGTAIRFPGASVDITERKQAEERQRLLMQELAHRVKNTLAVVQALSSQTLRGGGTITEMREAFTARLLALAQAHDVLMQGSWTEASMRALVDGAARMHGHGDTSRFRITGPDVMLGSKAALSFALILHELGTNAVKYGALATQAGHVAVTWQEDNQGSETRLRFRWQEIGGPTVTPPSRQGFGSRLIERSLTQGLGASVQLAYLPEGVTLSLDAPLSALQQN
jgi:PAS domain S-box-containing protein